jgi:hypothetical protein
MIRQHVLSFCAAILLGVPFSEAALDPIVIDYFYEPGCSECEKIDSRILPAIEAEFAGRYVLVKHDTGVTTNVLLLLNLEKGLGVTNTSMNCMYLDRQYPFYGFAKMNAGLLVKMRELEASRMTGNVQKDAVAVVPKGEAGNLVVDRVAGLTTTVVVMGGLLDGINPCAISTLIFFMSLLAVAHVGRHGLLVMGLTFCLASFLTYVALGFGLLRTLHLLDGFKTLRHGLEYGMIGLLGVMACLSFRDAWRYRRSHNPKDVSLQLPSRVKLRIHDIMRTGVHMRSLAVGGLLTGFVVTALESVCTGQVYVPTLVLIIKNSPVAGDAAKLSGLTFHAWKWLLLYNAMFMVPLVVIFTLTYFGLRTDSLLKWSQRNVVTSKILIGCFFVLMAALIVGMR